MSQNDAETFKVTPEEKKKRIDILTEIGGISPATFVFYLESLSFNTERSYACFIKATTIEPTRENAKVIFELVQEGLTHSAAMSRYFWPARTKNKLHKLRGDALRKNLEFLRTRL